ncbi:hypothetical protein K402DRAFT_173848 [Aulographum hederae CBS 113979]|uniref:Uncharacterized protein n=1 Tax=Aulographum hederae CBS 113979 TaxID=1176131 RepID=A0A6G1HDW3_9PEZI|nr:hypothetical protein K402DRAFT_173848 [Aulographum hederae CBS 113979]
MRRPIYEPKVGFTGLCNHTAYATSSCCSALFIAPISVVEETPTRQIHYKATFSSRVEAAYFSKCSRLLNASRQYTPIRPFHQSSIYTTLLFRFWK